MVWGLNHGRGKIFFPSSKCPDWLWGPVGLSGNEGSILEVKWLRHEVNHSPLSSDKVENEWSCTFTPVYLYGVEREHYLFFFTFNNVL
jgi:hypothetical protein